MDNEIKPEKYRKLSVAALVTGILSLSLALLHNFFLMLFAIFIRRFVYANFIPNAIEPATVISHLSGR